MRIPKYEIAFLDKSNQEIVFLTSNFLLRAKYLAKRILRYNPFFKEAIILKRGIEKEWFNSPFQPKKDYYE